LRQRQLIVDALCTEMGGRSRLSREERGEHVQDRRVCADRPGVRTTIATL
jgi:hypothetical protein